MMGETLLHCVARLVHSCGGVAVYNGGVLPAGLLLVKLLPPPMTSTPDEQAPLIAGDPPESPLHASMLQHTDEDALVSP